VITSAAAKLFHHLVSTSNLRRGEDGDSLNLCFRGKQIVRRDRCLAARSNHLTNSAMKHAIGGVDNCCVRYMGETCKVGLLQQPQNQQKYTQTYVC